MSPKKKSRGQRKETGADNRNRKYHGLMNQGATCYLNSVLQVLFMTKEFRDAVKRNKAESGRIDPHLTALFDDLTKGTSQTCDITNELGIIRVYEQRDAAEYFEEILRHTSPDASQIFKGELTHRNKCSDCDTETDTDGPVWTLPLTLENSDRDDYSVVDGIQMFFTASVVGGDDRMYCDQCDAKADATVSYVMKSHPEVLVLLLKRFQFDNRYMVYVKNSCRVDVPCTLQIPQGETYELYGFVDHYGNVTGGHYTATIRSQDDNTWYDFNDASVSKCYRQPFQSGNTNMSSSAYLLFYRKKKVKAADTSHNNRKVSNNGSFQSDTSHEKCDANSRKRKKNEEAADLHTVKQQEQEEKRRIVEDRGEAERQTGDDTHVEEHTEKMSVKNGKRRENERQKCAAHHQNSKQSRKQTKKSKNKGKHQGKETSDNVGQKRSEDQKGKKEPDSVHSDKCEVEVDEESRTQAGESKKAESETFSTKHMGFQVKGRVDDTNEKIEKNDGISASCTRHERQRAENDNVTEDKEQMTSEPIRVHEVSQELSIQHSCVVKKENEEVLTKVELITLDKKQTNDEKEETQEISCNLNADSVDKQEAKMDGKGDRQRQGGDAQRRETLGSQRSEGLEEKPQEQAKGRGIPNKDVQRQKEEEKDQKHIHERKESRQTGSTGSREMTEKQTASHDQDEIHEMERKRHSSLAQTSRIEVTEAADLNSPNSCDLHGLKNQGATSNLNSVLQVLFRTEEFREAIERHTGDSECIELHLKTLFDDLTKGTAQTCDITKYLGISNVYEQDAAEYFDKILTSLATPEASQIFQGHLMYKNKCSKCNTVTGTPEPFWNLRLELVKPFWRNCSVEDGIDKYFRTSDISGDDQMYCDVCEDKSDSTTRCVINHHPEVLTLLLKRFWFDNHDKRYYESSCSVDVPQTLKIPEGETYELYGIVDQNGRFYTARIKYQEDKTWYKFDDTSVTKLRWSPLGTLNSPHLLFYRKQNVKRAAPQATRKVSNNESFQSDTSHTNKQCDVKTRNIEEDEEAAGRHLHTVGQQESKNKRIKEGRGDTERETGHDKHVGEQTEKILGESGERRENERQRNEKIQYDNNEKHKGKETLDNVGQHKSQDHVYKERLVVQTNEESTSGVDKWRQAELGTRALEFQNYKGVDDSKEHISKNKGISNTSSTRYEQQREDNKNVTDDKEQMRATTLHELKNQGATSNLNSVLQVLLRTKEFREAIERHTGDSECIELHLKTLFDDLTKGTAQTCDITKYLGISNVYEQDAAEYFDKILTSLKTPEASQIFQGHLMYKNKCIKCNTVTGTPEPFWNLRLDLVKSFWGKYSVEDGINKYFRTSYIRGDDQMYCDVCEAKSDSTTKRVINHHPEVLTLLLKRFQFDDYNRTYYETSCSVDVPQTLKIPEGETYELYGIVDQNGRSATIKYQEDKMWYKFDDTSVSKFRLSPLGNLKCSSPHLLFYRKQNVKRAAPQATRKVSNNGSFQSDTSHTNKQCDQCTSPARTYYGLMNQGATCYLNSVLQVLYMTKEFREAIERHTGDSECIEHHLKTLFKDLNRYESYTYKITNYLGISNVYEQQDAAEYFDKILTSLTSREASQEDGINKYFKKSDISGEDQMYCDHCQAKSDSTIKRVVEKHPEVLMLLLKRFKFQAYYESYRKISCPVDVPRTLQIPEGGTYELCGFVDHFGGLTGGHYTATIKCQDDETWYEFDDTRVTKLRYQWFQIDNTQRLRSAYLLFYRKKNVKAAAPQDTRKVSNNGSFQSDTSHTNKQCDVKTRNIEKDEEAAGRRTQENKNKTIKEGRGDTERETGHDKHVGEQTEKILGENGERRENERQKNEKIQYDNNNEKHMGKETLDNVGQHKSQDQDSKQEHGSVYVHKERPVVQTNEESGAGDRKKASVTVELGTSSEWQNDKGVDDSKEHISKNMGISNTSSTRYERQREDKKNVTDDKEQMTPRTYYGFRNYGETYYLKSVLQVLYMTKEFREAIERHTGDSECIEHHLKTLFDDLTKGTAQTCDITKYLGIKDVYKHEDAAEYFVKILTSLTSPEASQIFQGRLTHKKKCSKCSKVTDTPEPFWHLCLELVKTSWSCSVEEGIDKYFRTSDIINKDQMYCDHCEAKSSTTKRVINHHPEVLTLLLKTFRFDDYYKRYYETSCFVDVPQSLQIPEGETYELYGFVERFGRFYTATIRSQDDDTWYDFNDASVSKCYRQPFQSGNTDMSSSAYLLFYRKKSVKAANIQDTSNGSLQSDTSHEKCDANSRKRKEGEEAAEGDQKGKRKKMVEDSGREGDSGAKDQDQDRKQEPHPVHADKQGDEKCSTQDEFKATLCVTVSKRPVVSQNSGGGRDDIRDGQRKREGGEDEWPQMRGTSLSHCCRSVEGKLHEQPAISKKDGDAEGQIEGEENGDEHRQTRNVSFSRQPGSAGRKDLMKTNVMEGGDRPKQEVQKTQGSVRDSEAESLATLEASGGSLRGDDVRKDPENDDINALLEVLTISS